MSGFNFEKNLKHQTQAVNSTIAVFENIEIEKPVEIDKNFINPQFDFINNNIYSNNILKIQELNNCKEGINRNSNIIDIMMETGTGKTYTYTKTIFELNEKFGIFKFVVIVPTLSIKAGTIDFLKSDSAREHFKEQYSKTIKLHIVESQKSKKNKKSYLPAAVSSFVNAGIFEKNSIQVMIINAGMINSDTMKKSFDTGLFDKYTVPFEAIAAVKPFVIIDEPHKFAQANSTWSNIQEMEPQFILRYGATFQEYENLVYTLTAVDSFNNNLVKGVIGHITEFESGKNVLVSLLSADTRRANFRITERQGNNTTERTVEIIKGESLNRVHSNMANWTLKKSKKSPLEVVFSNDILLTRGDKINPFSYAQTLQEIMIQKTIKSHFKLEKELLTREVKIKPLTLFFIDNIEEYRNENGYIKTTVEKFIKAEVESLLKTEKDKFYKAYLNKTLQDISKTHGGYFSKDNSSKDEAIEKEVVEILHDKQAMLDLDNPRRFIFSKWTLREGWDNPNVFQICKLRSSGSEISKLQEVGRGLRLPVNEYGNRVKGEDKQFYLNYFVDFTENDFVDKLVNEINEKSGAISIEDRPEKLTEEMIKQIVEKYDFSGDNSLIGALIAEKVINYVSEFLEGGFDYIKCNYPLIFQGVESNKIRKETDIKKKISIRTEKYSELKDLWEKLNEKVILEYKFEKESDFQSLVTRFLKEQKSEFTIEGVRERKQRIEIRDDQAVSSDDISVLDSEISPVSTMKYSEFLQILSKALNINLKTLHQSFIESKIEINKYLNNSTIRIIKQKFNDFLMYNAFDKFSIEYKKVSNTIHPTKLTDKKGNILSEIIASAIGHPPDDVVDDEVAESYFFDELFYDSKLEGKNIKQEITEVIVFTKIPKNSIKIPVAGGKSYSPDFAYVINFDGGDKKLYFIVETKDVLGNDDLRNEEKQKIKHAEQFFNNKIKISFKTQFSNNKMVDLIREIKDINPLS